MSQFPPRIHILLARQAPVGLVIRRGPSKSVATMLWDRDRDTFHLGQWLKGRIYERRSDISPDGKHVIYFAMNGKWQSESRGSWTAISRVPYLKAIAFFPKGDCWHGGGLWTGKTKYWLNDGYGHAQLHNTSSLQRDIQYQPEGGCGGECLSVYYPRLLRDGWTWIDRIKVRQWQDKDIFEKPIGQGWTLRKIAHAEVGAPVGKGCYWDEHELIGPDSATAMACPTWEWAEMDNQRLVWAAAGKLYAAQVRKDGLTNETVLFDFNDMVFEAIEAPY
ncbi:MULTISPECIES: hypothetical protein [Cyanophyceae]|uniref:hypothetical protein n=1 Tax=Cyanophyceae TaxID=3028117 RepID=UPI001684C2D7|nr:MULTISPECIES: hypothetical protein [Cyanophyceae]MBD1916833.1 hypothetical protein [Phormidium sp. FACHB-77]MBD2029464.1 hypothetical protein [Phormidium sp. FACHB-322]MBD2052040.1 hypothetical protein [Leptolyngbya sp. FACHB-60]